MEKVTRRHGLQIQPYRLMVWALLALLSCSRTGISHGPPTTRPNIVLIMTDDQGWGQTGYYNHPVLKTPNLDAMAANGLRFDRFYAGAPVCSPTRASVLTGRASYRTGVPEHGYPLRLQEKTVAAALKTAGYSTGHFGKWHLNGLRGPGVPVLKDDDHNPGAFGFDQWLTVTNFFDMNPIMSRQGTFVEFQGDSSAVIVKEAISFIRSSIRKKTPFFAVIWDGSPHSPWGASEEDRQAFKGLNEKSQHHYGELVAFDRSLGTLRRGLHNLGVAEDTLLWYCSDNGGLPEIKPDTVGGLRGNKGSVWEGGLRVPGIIEWPAVIRSRVTRYPASTMDIFPTLAHILDLPDSVLLNPIEGVSLTPLFEKDLPKREKPIPFRYRNRGALVDNDYKLVATDWTKDQYELYHLVNDPTESNNIAAKYPDLFNSMQAGFKRWNLSVENSIAGKDYPEGKVHESEPISHFWTDDERYRPFFDKWVKRPEYAQRLKNVLKKK
jgi:arylsulfatase A-like enzyme